MRVILAGTGCGSLDNMTMEVRQALLEADLIIGAKRLLEGLPEEFKGCRRPAIYAQEICDIILDALQEADSGFSKDSEAVAAARTPEPAGAAADGSRSAGSATGKPKICVAFSGDSGFYSGTRTLLPLLQEAGIEAEVLPGISSIQVFSSRLQQPWQDWRLVSAHGTDCDAVTAVMQGQPVFFLTGGKLTPKEICAQLKEAGLGELPVSVGERLTYEDERILTGKAEEFAQQEFAPLSVMLAHPAPGMGDMTPGIDDDLFVRGDVPMTKETVRAAILGHMQVYREDTVWDVGAGTGSVSVELAMKAFAGRVYAVEREVEGCDLIRRNREKFGVWNLCPVEGAAPEALQDLPAPDKVFIGGSDGHLEEIIDIALEKNTDVRICISAIVLETMQEAISVMASAGMETKIIQVAVNTARQIGKGTGRHMMMAGNPIFIITGQRQRDLSKAPEKQMTIAERKRAAVALHLRKLFGDSSEEGDRNA